MSLIVLVGVFSSPLDELNVSRFEMIEFVRQLYSRGEKCE
jgi:hypothetical protein